MRVCRAETCPHPYGGWCTVRVRGGSFASRRERKEKTEEPEPPLVPCCGSTGRDSSRKNDEDGIRGAANDQRMLNIVSIPPVSVFPLPPVYEGRIIFSVSDLSDRFQLFYSSSSSAPDALRHRGAFLVTTELCNCRHPRGVPSPLASRRGRSARLYSRRWPR